MNYMNLGRAQDNDFVNFHLHCRNIVLYSPRMTICYSHRYLVLHWLFYLFMGMTWS